MRVAVLGATGHVGSGLTDALISRTDWTVTALGRSRPRLGALLAAVPSAGRLTAADIGSFGDEPFDLVVNATGAREAPGTKPDRDELFRVAEHFDEVVADYLRRHDGSRAIAMSSGAAYLSDFERPAGAAPNPPADEPEAAATPTPPIDAYGMAKAASEARHREAADLPIVDLRLFGFFSRFVDPSASFLLSQAMRHIRSGTTLVTDRFDVVRDVAHPMDLAALVIAVADAAPMNRALDVFGARPAAKFEILEMLAARFGLAWEADADSSQAPATGRKPRYFSLDHAAARFGFAPAFTTLGCVAAVTSSLVESWGRTV